MRTTIYALRENHFVKYVGKTKYSLEKRLSNHLITARRGEQTYRARWIRRMLQEGSIPDITKIQDVEGDGCKEEIAWIRYFRDHGVKLTNGTAGGDGGDTYGTGLHRARMLENVNRSKRGRKHSDETKAKIAAKALGRKASPATKEKMSVARRAHSMPKWTEERRKKTVASLVGRLLSEETKKKMRGPRGPNRRTKWIS